MINILTSMRFMAAFLIYLHHLNYGGGLGPIGVSFFFILSGFILAYTYQGKFIKLSKQELRRFFTLRFTRVYPLHILTFLLAVPFIFWTEYKWSGWDALANIFLVQTYAPIGIHAFSFNGVSWAISDELFFYAIFPFLFFILYKFRLFSNPGKILVVLLISFGIPATIGYTLRNSMQGTNTTWWLVYIFPPVRMFDFIVGICVGMIFLRFKDKVRNTKLEQMLFTIGEIIAILLFVLSWKSGFLKYPTFSMGLYYIPSFAVILFVFSFQKGLISYFLANKVFTHLGDLSFSIYMLHQVVISYISVLFGYNIFGSNFHDLKHTVAQLAVFIIVIALSEIIYQYFENPIRSYFRFKTGKMITISSRNAWQ
jgi:peptidoglycan/LPS O-acetylase OafA/YrhL